MNHLERWEERSGAWRRAARWRRARASAVRWATRWVLVGGVIAAAVVLGLVLAVRHGTLSATAAMAVGLIAAVPAIAAARLRWPSEVRWPSEEP